VFDDTLVVGKDDCNLHICVHQPLKVFCTNFFVVRSFKYFNELDTLKIFKDYQMYFQFAIVQLHILNDPVAYELYIGKMKSILEINKVY
jgi:hypothetical protein